MSLADRILTRFGFSRTPVEQPSAGGVSNLSALSFSELVRMGYGSGGPLSEQTALSVSAVYACVHLIAGSIAGLPLNVYRREGGARRQDENHDLWWKLNEEMTARWAAPVGWEYLVASRLLQGDAFCRIVRASPWSNTIAGFEPIHPARVTVLLEKATRRLVYDVAPEAALAGDPRVVIDQDDMLHVPGLGFDGFRGLSPLQHYLRSAATVARAAQEMSEAFFENSARPDFVITSPKKPDDATLATLRETWNNLHQGSGRAFKPALLYGGMELKPLTMNLEDAQALETRQFQIEEIARIYGVPPFMIGHNEKTTSWGSGVEHMGIGFVRYTLMPHLVKFQTEVNRKCFSTANTFVEFDPSALMQGDIKGQFDAFRVALGRAGEPGFMSTNEVRHRLNLPPQPGGDTLASGQPAPAGQQP